MDILIVAINLQYNIFKLISIFYSEFLRALLGGEYTFGEFY